MSIIISGVGRIGKDAVTRHTQKGEPVTGFSLAMDNGFGDQKQTLWFDASGWGKRYEGAAAYLTKGAQVFVTGELGEREHDGKTYKTIRLTALDLVGGKSEAKPTGNTSSGRRQVPQDNVGKGDEPFPDDDIPFATNRGLY